MCRYTDTSTFFQRVYSRVARVCKNDMGGPKRFKRTWTSYVKTRLNCSVSGEFPFYFDEIREFAGPVRFVFRGLMRSAKRGTLHGWHVPYWLVFGVVPPGRRLCA